MYCPTAPAAVGAFCFRSLCKNGKDGGRYEMKRYFIRAKRCKSEDLPSVFKTNFFEGMRKNVVWIPLVLAVFCVALFSLEDGVIFLEAL